MHIDIITIFPEMFTSVLGVSIIKRAQQKGLLKVKMHNPRDYSEDKHRKVDDRPYGGGPGMIMRPEPIFKTVNNIMQNAKCKIKKPNIKHRASRIILLSPQGKPLTQMIVKRLVRYRHLILICGRYEGVDERVRKHLITDEISIGDYILTGGELPAMVLVDSLTRFIPGVLGKDSSKIVETFEQNLLEYPQYTRPANFNNYRVPEVLLSGNHSKIAQWRKKQALRVTRFKRPDLIKGTDTFKVNKGDRKGGK